MGSENRFRTSVVGGFNREDVVAYIEKLAAEREDYRAQTERLLAEKEELERSIELLRARVRVAEDAASEGRPARQRAEELEAECAALRERVEQLETLHGRAEEIEQAALENAAGIERRAAESISRIRECVTDVTQRAKNYAGIVISGAEELGTSLSQLKFDDDKED